MAEYRTVRTNYWGDPFIETLPPDGKLLYIYLFTGSKTNNLGLVEMTRQRMAFETGLSVDRIEAMLALLVQEKKAVVDGQLVWLTNFIKHQTSTSPKIIQSLVKIFPDVSSSQIRDVIRRKYPSIPWPADTLSIPYQNHTDTVCIPSPELEREREGEEREGGDCARACVASSMPENDPGIIQGDADLPKKTDCPSKGTPEWSSFLSCWQVYPVQQGQEEAWREWMRLKANGTLPPAWEIRDAILSMAAEDARWRRGKVPNMANWLRRKGWDDKPYIEPVETLPVPRGQPIARTQHQKGKQDLEGLAAFVMAADKEFADGFNPENHNGTQPHGHALPAPAGHGNGTPRYGNGLDGTVPGTHR